MSSGPSRAERSAAERAAAAELTLQPIGVVRSPFKVHEGTPRQPGVGTIADGEIVLRQGLQNALKDLAKFSHVWVLFWFNYSRGWNEQVTPPRDVKKRGLFATRSPHRPNPIGMSVVQLLGVRGTRLTIRGHDLLDGTPVLDLKPYVPYVDSIPHASSGWLAELPPEPRPDHRSWRKAAKSTRARRSARSDVAGGVLFALAALAPAAVTPGCSRDSATNRGGGSTPSQAASGSGATGVSASPDVLDGPIERPSRGDPSAAAPFLQQAAALEAALRVDDALRAYDEALARDPASLPALLGRGFLLLGKGEEEGGAALLCFRRAAAVASDAHDSPEAVVARCGEGVARAAVGDSARAEPLLRRSRTELPANAALRRALVAAALADVCATSGRSDEALTLYGEADLLLATDGPPVRRAGVLVRAADLLAQLGRASEAEAKLDLALGIDPQNLRAHYLLSQLLEKRGATEEAKRKARLHELFRQLRDHVSPRFMDDVARRVDLWREIAATAPEYRRAGYELTRELLAGAKWDDALTEIATLEKRDGTTPELHYLTARARAGKGDLAGARAAADAMRRADPRVPPAVLRAVLDDWRRGNPSIDAATFEKTAREWLGGG